MTIEVDEEIAEILKQKGDDFVSESVMWFMKETARKEKELVELAKATSRRDSLYQRTIVLFIIGRIDFETAKFLIAED